MQGNKLFCHVKNMNFNFKNLLLFYAIFNFCQFSFASEIPAERLSKVRDIASQAIENKDFESALSAYNELSVQFSGNISIANDMAVILAGMGKLDDARLILENAIVNNKSTGSAFLNLREILARQASISYTKALKRKSPPEILVLRSPGLDTARSVKDQSKKSQETKLSKLDDFSNNNRLPLLGSEVPTVVLENEDEIIKQLIISWANSWSKKDFESYIEFYSPKFKTKKFKTKKSWAKFRKPRVKKKGAIQVKIQNQKIKLISGVLAEVKFTQKYKSANLRLSTSKKIRLEKSEDGWKIISEGT